MIKKSLCVALSGLILSAAAVAAPLELETQGSFAIGGSVVQKPGTFSEDHFLSPEGQKAYGVPNRLSARRRSNQKNLGEYA